MIVVMRAALLLLTCATLAHADGADPIAAGEALAKAGQFTDAIAQWKQVPPDSPQRAQAECRIALGYRRLERWAQAKLFLAHCVTSTGQPDWVPQLVTDINNGIAHAQLAPVTFSIHHDPPPVDIAITATSFAPDESFAPQTIYVAPGDLVVVIDAAGYKPKRVSVSISSTAP